MNTEVSRGSTAGTHQAAMLGWMQEIAPYGIFTTDAELRIQSWNEWLETHSGLAAPVVIGRPLLEVFPDLQTRKLDEHFRRALSGEVIVLSSAFHEYLLPFESTVRDAHYTWMQQTARIAPLTLNDRPCGTIAVIEDVTQRESQAGALSRQLDRNQLLSSSLAHLLTTRDPENMLRDLFPRFAKHLRVDGFISYLVEPDAKHLRLHSAAGLPEETDSSYERIPIDATTASGRIAAERRPVILHNLQPSSDSSSDTARLFGAHAVIGYPLMVGDRLIGTLAFGSRSRATFSGDEIELIGTLAQYAAIGLDRAISDIALRKAQQQLSEHALGLEAKVLERTAKLQDTIAQLESFSYTVAHDLRAPIRALKGYAQVLLEQSISLPQDSRTYLSRIERAANRLDVLTRDLLQFSTISRQDVVLSRVDVAEVLQDLRILRPALNDDVLIVKHTLHPVLAHRTLLQHCLANLLDNALKFVPPDVSPRIVISSQLISRAHSDPGPSAGPAFIPATYPGTPGHSPNGSFNEPGKCVQIWIEDNGIGIAPESHQKIFGIFERLNAPDKYEGTGIGLAIVARAMQRMNGTCGVESGPGQGSRFWLKLESAESAA